MEFSRKTQDALLTAVMATDAYLAGASGDSEEELQEKLDHAINLAHEEYAEADREIRELFDGRYYNPQLDDERLSKQLGRVFDCVSTGHWYTLEEIADVTGDKEASISAQLRHLRKARHGSWMIDVENQGGGLFGYRMRNPDGSSIPPVNPRLPGEE